MKIDTGKIEIADGSRISYRTTGDMNKTKIIKTIPLSYRIWLKLSQFKLDNQLKSFNNAVEELLNKQEENK